jgi:muramoyltetrapeptide carboxypeptidase
MRWRSPHLRVSLIRSDAWIEVGSLAITEKSRLGASERADEFNTFIRNPKVRMIISTIGGYSCNGIVDALDYAALSADPKIIVGYSDITPILLAVYAKTGLITFHGPTLLAEIAEFPDLLPMTKGSFLNTLMKSVPAGLIVPAQEWTDEFLAWDMQDDRARIMNKSEGWRWVKSGAGTGTLLGGNLESMRGIAGSTYWPNFKNAVFMWETISTNIDQIDQSITHLEMLGVFDEMKAMLVGRPFRGSARFEVEWRTYLSERFCAYDVPIVADVDLGHTDPMYTFPIGSRIKVDSSECRVEILDAGVR